jgi:N-acetylneuraminate lyase
MGIEHITGLVAAPYTPMNKDGSINYSIVEPYKKLLISNGVAGVFVNGTSGEGISLTIEERKKLAELWVKDTPKEFKVLIHVGHNSLAESKGLAKHAQEIGAFGIGSIGSIFFRAANAEGLVDYCAKIAAAAPDLPFYHYHIPSITKIDISMYDFLKIADEKIPNMGGIKFTFEALMDYELCLRFKNKKYNCLFGRDEMFYPAYVMGARGAIGSTYNFAAPLYHNLVKAVEEKDLEKALSLQLKSIDLIQAMIKSGSFISGSKAILTMLGVKLGCVRYPLLNLTDEKIAILKDDLTELGFFEEGFGNKPN